MSNGRLLSDDERKRFARYLRENVESSRLILRHMGALPLVFDKRMRVEIEAFEFVASWLEKTESQMASR